MKKIVVFFGLLVCQLAVSQTTVDNKKNIVEIRTIVEIETQMQSFSAVVTLNDKDGYSSKYNDGLKYRTFDEQVDVFKNKLDSIGIKKNNISKDAYSSSSTYYRKSVKYNLVNLTKEQLDYISSLNKGTTYVTEKKAKVKTLKSESEIMEESYKQAKEKALIVAKLIDRKLGNVNYVINSSNDFKNEEERIYYENDTYNQRYYMVFAFELVD